MRDRSRTTVRRASRRAVFAAALMTLTGTVTNAAGPGDAIGPMPPLPLPADGIHSNPFCVPDGRADQDSTAASPRMGHRQESEQSVRLVSGHPQPGNRRQHLRPAVTGVVLSPLQLSAERPKGSVNKNAGANLDGQATIASGIKAPGRTDVSKNPFAAAEQPRRSDSSSPEPSKGAATGDVASSTEGNGWFSLSDTSETSSNPGRSSLDGGDQELRSAMPESDAEATAPERTPPAKSAASSPSGTDHRPTVRQPHAGPDATGSESETDDPKSLQSNQERRAASGRKNPWLAGSPDADHQVAVIEAVEPDLTAIPEPEAPANPTGQAVADRPASKPPESPRPIDPIADEVAVANPGLAEPTRVTSPVVQEAKPTLERSSTAASQQQPQLVSPRRAAVIRVETVDDSPAPNELNVPRRVQRRTDEEARPTSRSLAAPRVIEAPAVLPDSPFKMQTPSGTPVAPTGPVKLSLSDVETAPDTGASDVTEVRLSDQAMPTENAVAADDAGQADTANAPNNTPRPATESDIRVEVSGKRAVAKVIRPGAVPPRVHVVQQKESAKVREGAAEPAADPEVADPAPELAATDKAQLGTQGDASGREGDRGATESPDTADVADSTRQSDPAGRLRPPVAVVAAPVSFKRGSDSSNEGAPPTSSPVMTALPLAVDSARDRESEASVAPQDRSDQSAEDFLEQVPDDAQRSELAVELAQVRSLTLSAPLKNYRVANDAVCQVIRSGQSQLKLIGTGLGETQLVVWADSKADQKAQCILFDVKVKTALDASGTAEVMTAAQRLDKSIRQVFPTARVRVGYDGSRLIVSGYCDDQQAATEILRLIRKSCLIPVVDALVIR